MSPPSRQESLEQLHNEPLLEDANWWVVKKIAVGALDEDVALANVSTMVAPPLCSGVGTEVGGEAVRFASGGTSRLCRRISTRWRASRSWTPSRAASARSTNWVCAMGLFAWRRRGCSPPPQLRQIPPNASQFLLSRHTEAFFHCDGRKQMAVLCYHCLVAVQLCGCLLCASGRRGAANHRRGGAGHASAMGRPAGPPLPPPQGC